MTEIIATVADVASYQFTAKSGPRKGEAGFRYEVMLSDGNKYTTFNDDLGKAAMSLKGQEVKVEASSKERNGYTNFYLDSLEKTGRLSGETTATTPIPTVSVTTPDTRQTMIVRQNVLRTAFNFVAATGSTDFDKNKEVAYTLAAELYGVVFHGSEHLHTKTDSDEWPESDIPAW